MSYELINRITIKKDKLTISTKSSNVSEPYKVSEYPELFNLYKQKGQRALDKYFLKLGMDDTEYTGKHPSILPYKNALSLVFFSKQCITLRDKIYDLRQENNNIYWGNTEDQITIDQFFDKNCKNPSFLSENCKKYIENRKEIKKLDDLIMKNLLDSVSSYRKRLENEKTQENNIELE